MRTVLAPLPHPPPRTPVALAIGNFDGVHLGHRAVLESTVAAAAALGGEPWVLTFDPHPAVVLRPERAPRMLTTAAQREALLAAAGIATWWHMPFDRGVAALSPREFVNLLVTALPSLGALRVGEDWRFGQGASGNLQTLHALAAERNITVAGLPAVSLAGDRVSSTRIRAAIADGRMEAAAALLGRPYALTGTVVPGRGFARQLGFPSANVEVEQEVFPPDGIYACRVRLEGAVHAGAGYVPRGARTFEVHLVGYSGDAYGRRVEAELTHRIRPDRAISDLQALREAIAEDVREVVRLLGPNPA